MKQKVLNRRYNMNRKIKTVLLWHPGVIARTDVVKGGKGEGD